MRFKLRRDPDIYHRLDEIEKELAQAKALATAYFRIDLVECEGRLAYYFVDDASYQFLPPSARKNLEMAPLLAQQHRGRPSASPPTIFVPVFEHYWSHHLPFTFVDVGANAGAVSIDVWKAFQYAGREHRLIAFEPGVYRQLLCYNFELNGLTSACIELSAVSDYDGLALMVGELGMSVNNRIDLRNIDTEWRSNVVRTVTLDRYCLSHSITDHLIIKIDTQGSDWKVIRGASRLIEERYVVMLVEFTPWALRSYCDPLQELAQLLQTSWVINCGPHTRGPTVVITDPVQSVSAIDQSAELWTDLLVIPKKLPASEMLLQSIINSHEP